MRVVALTFHDVVAEGQAGSARPMGEAFYRITAAELEALLSHLRRLGYRTVSSRHFRAWQQGQGTIPEHAVVFTFDDGYASHFEVATSLLARYRYSGTFFITPEKVGQSGFVTWGQLRKMVFLGMEIGSHGYSHAPLTQLKLPALMDELTTSRRVLEEQLGVPVRALAVPGGFWNRTVAEATRQAGYDAVWLSTIGANGRETSPHALRRVVVRQPFSVEHVVALVEGSRPAFLWAANQQKLIRLLKRILGVYWYEQLKRRLVPNA